MAKQYFYSDLTEDQKQLLSPAQIEIFKIKEEGNSWDEISMIRGSSVAAARANYYQGTKKLRNADQGIIEAKRNAPKTLTIHEMANACDEKAGEILQLMTPKSIAAATLAQKASAFGVLIEKGRLLRGEATQIISHDDRRTLKELIPAFLKEAERRQIDLSGITLDGDFTEV